MKSGRLDQHLWTDFMTGGRVWPGGVKVSSMESPDGDTRPTGATEMTSLDRPHDRRAVWLPSGYQY